MRAGVMGLSVYPLVFVAASPSPYRAPVKRLDEVKAAKDLVLCYAPGWGIGSG
jgi:hypothetical protein